MELQHLVVKRGRPIVFAVPLLAAFPLPEYQWRRNGVDIHGANSRTFEVTQTQEKDAGTYTCVVTNIAGSVTWEEVLVSFQS